MSRRLTIACTSSAPAQLSAACSNTNTASTATSTTTSTATLFTTTSITTSERLLPPSTNSESPSNLHLVLPDAHHCTLLIPPFRYETIEAQLYRGAYPTLKNFRFLQRKRLRTIISLIPEAPTLDLTDFAKASLATVHHFKVSKYKEAVSIRREQVCRIVELLISPENHPAYIHCLDGSNVTSLAVACLRKLQNWCHASIVGEFARFVQGVVSEEELQFLNEFVGEIAVPLVIPAWLWGGQSQSKHAQIRLKAQPWHRSASERGPPEETLPENIAGDCGVAAAAAGHADEVVPDELEDVNRKLASYSDMWITRGGIVLPVTEQRRRHDRAKKSYSLRLRSLGLASPRTIAYRLQMIPMEDLVTY